MNETIYINATKLRGEFFPSWDVIPEQVWKQILKRYFFQVSDSFGFSEVLETKDLFPLGLNYFKDWQLNEIGLVETPDKNISCRFELNEHCKEKLLQNEFAVHQKGFEKPINYWEFDSEHYYYEFDILNFFKGERLIGYFVNHEDMIAFTDEQHQAKLFATLDEGVRNRIFESEEIEKKFKGKCS